MILLHAFSTPDPLIKSQLLYQLSQGPMFSFQLEI